MSGPKTYFNYTKNKLRVLSNFTYRYIKKYSLPLDFSAWDIKFWFLQKSTWIIHVHIKGQLHCRASYLKFSFFRLRLISIILRLWAIDFKSWWRSETCSVCRRCVKVNASQKCFILMYMYDMIIRKGALLILVLSVYSGYFTIQTLTLVQSTNNLVSLWQVVSINQMMIIDINVRFTNMFQFEF